jgi:hypothetical protein
MKSTNRQIWSLLVGKLSSRGASARGSLVGSIIRDPTLAIIAVSCIWLLLVILVNPVGEFPLNDDWSYARAVQSLVEHGRLELTGFTSMPLISQVLWGALFCLPFGFSFTALRVSTIMLGLLGILATYGLFEEIKMERPIAFLTTMAVAFNPLYFHLSLTFMTDVPFFTFSMFAFLFFLRALRTERFLDLALGYVFSLIAILIRQLAIAIPVSFLGAYLIKNRISIKALINTLIPTMAFAGLLLVFPAILRRTIGLPALYNRAYEPITEAATLGWFQIPFVFADRLLVELIYLGLFILPVLVMLGVNTQLAHSTQTRRLSIFAGAAVFITIISLLFWQGRTMPLSGNILFDIGLGPVLLRDTYLLRLPHWPTAPKELWLFVTVVAVLGSILLIRRVGLVIVRMIKLLSKGSRDEQVSISFLLFSAVFLYSIFIAITGFLDRYLIWLLPLLMCVMLVRKNYVQLHTSYLSFSVAVVIIAIYGLFAFGGTHDYLAWNRARWQAIADLMEKDGISFNNIDGGFEFNGWYAYDAGYHISPSKSWWWVDNDDYVISFGPISGYREIRRYPFKKLIPPEEGNIFVLQRLGE